MGETDSATVSLSLSSLSFNSDQESSVDPSAAC